MHSLTFDVAHMLAGSLVLVSFVQLYQDRLYALLNIFRGACAGAGAFGGMAGLRAGCTASLRDSGDCAGLQGDRHPVALHRIIVRLGIHREIEKVVGVGPAMLLGMGSLRSPWWSCCA